MTELPDAHRTRDAEARSATGSAAGRRRRVRAAAGPVFNPATGEQTRRGRLRLGRGGRPRRRRRQGGLPGLARGLALAARRALLPHPPAPPRAPRGHRAAPHRRARQGALRRAGRGRARARGGRVRVRDPDAAQGRLLGAGLDRDRRLLDPAAARRRRRDHAVQLPGDGAHVDVGAGDRVREHVRAQAVGEGPVRVALTRRAAEGGRGPGRRLQRRPRRQGRGRPDPRAPGHRRRQLRRLDADRALHLRDGHEARQARAGARRGEEPHDRAAGRRHRHGRRRGGQRGVRLGGRALHGRLRGRRGRRRGRPLVEAIKERLPKVKVGDGLEPGVEMGPLVTREHRDKVASYIERGARAGRDGRRRRARDDARGRRLLPRRLAARQRDARDGRVPRRDLRPRALGRRASNLRRGACGS